MRNSRRFKKPGSLAGLSDDRLSRLLRKPIPNELRHCSLPSSHGDPFLAPPCRFFISTLEETADPSGNVPSRQQDVDLLRQLLDPAQNSDEYGRLPGYRLLKLIGVGGMGLVFQADDLTLQRMVAIKMIRPTRLRRSQALTRFLAEARSAARLPHDHIVTVHHVGQHHQIPYLVMELLKGESLAGRLRRVGVFPVPQALSIVCQVAQGLAAAHKVGLVHRDIKPDNIWIEAETDRVKLLDFGLAHLLESDSPLKASVGGTPLYIAPEQDLDHSCDPRSDLYSLGVVLHEMLAGTTPRSIAGPPESQRPDLPGATAHLSLLPAPFDRNVTPLLSRMLATDPGKRVQTAEQVIAAISEILSAPVKSSREPSPGPATRRPENAWRIRIVFLICLLPLSASLYWANQYRVAVLKAAQLDWQTKVYPAQIFTAQKAWQDGDLLKLGTILDDLLPADDQPDLRGWEWHYLNSFREPAVAVLHEAAQGFSSVAVTRNRIAWVERGSAAIQIRDISHNRIVGEILVPDSSDVSGLTFSANGQRIACLSPNGTLYVWDIASQTCLLCASKRSVCLALDSTGDRLFAANGRWAYVFDVTTASLVRQWELSAEATSTAFSPDGLHIAVASASEEKLLVYESARWTEVARYVRPKDSPRVSRSIFNFAWHPDSRHIAMGVSCPPRYRASALDGHADAIQRSSSGADGAIVVWEFEQNRVSSQFPAFPALLYHTLSQMAFSADGKYLATGEVHGSLAIWDPWSRQRLAVLPSGKGELSAISWFDGDQYIGTGAVAGEISCRSWRGQQPWLKLNATGRVGWTYDGRQVVAKAPQTDPDAGVSVFDSGTGRLCDSIANPGGFISALACSPVDRRVAFATIQENDTLLISDLDRLNADVRFAIPRVYCLAWSPDGRCIAGGQGTLGTAVTVWTSDSGEVIWSANEHGSDVKSIDWSPDGALLATKDRRQSVRIWEASSGKLIRRLDDDVASAEMSDGQCSLRFSPDSRRLAVGYEGKVKIWELPALVKCTEIRAHAKEVMAIDWSPDGRRLATGSADYTTRVWDVETGQLLLIFEDEGPIAAVAFSPDGSVLASHAGPLGAIRLRSTGVHRAGTRGLTYKGAVTDDE